MPAPVDNSGLAAAVAAYVGVYREEFAIPLVTAAPDEPSSAPPSTHTQYTNTLTGDVYTAAARFHITRKLCPDEKWKTDLEGYHDSDVHSSAPVLVSDSAKTLVLPFRFGMVRHRSEVLDVAEQYYTQLKAAFESGQLSRTCKALVLCGHSEGGTVAEAVALQCVADPSRKFNLAHTFLVSSAAHLWMLESEVELLARAFDGRYVSYGAVLGTAYDPFLVKFVTLDRYSDDELDEKQLVSLPKTFCTPSDCVEVGSLRGGAELDGFACVTDMYAGQALHCWESYEERIKAAVARPSHPQVAASSSAGL